MSTRIKKYFLIPFVFVTIGYVYSYIDSSYAVDDSAYARSVGILILFSPIVYTIAIIINYILLLIVEKNLAKIEMSLLITITSLSSIISILFSVSVPTLGSSRFYIFILFFTSFMFIGFVWSLLVWVVFRSIKQSAP